jgi:DNA-binding protein Fis
MKLEKKIQLKNIEYDKEVVERLVDENLSGKLDKYLKKLDGEDVE